MTMTLTALERWPDSSRDLVRDMRERWALEEAGLRYYVRRLITIVLHIAQQQAGLLPEVAGVKLGELREFRERLKTMAQDVTSLSDHASYVSGNIAFLLDAALGLINVEQNTIVTIISITSVIFLPLTLIASIYGMNFEHMPFLHSPEGFWATCGIMVMIIIGLLWLFKGRRWI